MRTVGLYTLGCKVAQYETEAIGEEFVRRGLSVMPFESVCDCYVINTCTVTKESDRKSRQMIRRAIAKNRNAVVAVCGCYSQRSPEEITAIDGVQVVVGTDNKMSIVDEVIKRLESKEEDYLQISNLDFVDFEPMTVEGTPRTRAYVKIEDGCECRCTYCAIADARGRVRSKPKDDVIKEVEGLYKSGTREIVLTGIETGSYGTDFEEEYGLADLIRELDERHSCERIRLGSLAPELVGAKFVEKVKDCKILAPHFHMSMQSGSDSVLRGMKRRYNSKQALANIQRIRENIKGAQFTTDLMVGFPGESEEDFLQTLDFTRKAKFLDAHVFAYSRRKGTPASTYPCQIPEDIKHKRSQELIRVKNEVRDSILDEIVEKKEVLSCILETYCDGSYEGHSESFIEVSTEAPDGMKGQCVNVLPTSHKDGIVYGKIIK